MLLLSYQSSACSQESVYFSRTGGCLSNLCFTSNSCLSTASSSPNDEPQSQPAWWEKGLRKIPAVHFDLARAVFFISSGFALFFHEICPKACVLTWSMPRNSWGFGFIAKHDLSGATTAQHRAKGARSKHIPPAHESWKCLAEEVPDPIDTLMGRNANQNPKCALKLWPERGYESYSRPPLSPCTTCPQHIPLPWETTIPFISVVPLQAHSSDWGLSPVGEGKA